MNGHVRKLKENERKLKEIKGNERKWEDWFPQPPSHEAPLLHSSLQRMLRKLDL